MQLYIPEIGDKIELTLAWKFKLYHERRNAALFNALGLPYANDYSKRDEFQEVTLPPGTILTIDRIYIRKGLDDFSSISFFASGLIKNKSPRFWAKLNDCNNIEYDIVSTSTNRVKPKLIFADVPDVPASRYEFTYDNASLSIDDKERIYDITNSTKWDAPAVFHVRITISHETTLMSKEQMNNPWYKINNQIRYSWNIKQTRTYELLDIDEKPLGVTAINKKNFVKLVNEYYEKQ